MNALPVILDTDIGDDIDDAFALALILNSPQFELRGVTTVFRDAPRRAVLARHLLKLWQRDAVPVFAGCSKSLLQSIDPQIGSQFELLDGISEADLAGANLPEDTTSNSKRPHAIDFLISESGVDGDEASENPLTIIAIGPLTNVAMALAKAPQLASSARLLMMGGMWDAATPGYKAEWNIACDPEAAAMVFESGIEITMVGLDVTERCILEEKHIERIASHDSPQAEVLTRLIQLWERESHHLPILHDPLAVLTLIDDCVHLDEKKIEVALCGEARGQTRVVAGTANARVAVDVDVTRAIDLFMARVLA